MNTTTATSTVLSPLPASFFGDMKSGDIRAVLGITNERADEIDKLINNEATAEGFGENITGDLWLKVVGTLPTEQERLYTTWAIGHGIGMSEDADDDSHTGFGDEQNPLASMLAAFGGNNDEDDSTDEQGVPGTNNEEL